MSYTHAGGIDRPLVITRNGTSVIPHQNWRGQFSSGTYANGSLSDCPAGVNTGCTAVAWPGWRTTVWHADAKEPDIRNWYGGLVDGMRDASGQTYMRNRYHDPSGGQGTVSVSLEEVVGGLAGLRCEGLDNPIGSIPAHRPGPAVDTAGDPPTARPHGWRHLTVFSPWRVQTDQEVLSDWNVDGGPSGLIEPSLQPLLGLTVEHAVTRPPAWDLVVSFSGGIQLVVFGDCMDLRDHAWFILGADGVRAVAEPVIRPLGLDPDPR